MSDANASATVNVSELVREWERERDESGFLPAHVLFPHVNKLTDAEVQSFYRAVEERGYHGGSFETVDDVRHFIETHKIITRCYLDGLIR